MKKKRAQQIFELALEEYRKTGAIPSYEFIRDTIYREEDIVVSVRDVNSGLSDLKDYVAAFEGDINKKTAESIGLSVIALVQSALPEKSQDASSLIGSQADLIERNVSAMKALRKGFEESSSAISDAIASGDREGATKAIENHQTRINGLIDSIIELNAS